MSSLIEKTISAFITDQVGIPVSSIQLSSVGGGSINRCFEVLINKNEKLFCKINSASKFPDMFKKEKNGLEALGARKVIKLPAVIATFLQDDHQFLLLEWIEQGPRTKRFWELFGQQLADLHSVASDIAGFAEDNYMGALPQSNTLTENWCDFFIQQRLEPQIDLALRKGLLNNRHKQQFQKLYSKLPAIFPDSTLCLLHGDLWSGNFLCDHSGSPVLIDPAVYHGHPAIDLGMTTLFGGFDTLFYEAYKERNPFPLNHRLQWEISNLYPLLIHLNLFGKGYLESITACLDNY